MRHRLPAHTILSYPISQHCIPGLLGRADYTTAAATLWRPSPAIYPNVTRLQNNACACTAICVWLGNMSCPGTAMPIAHIPAINPTSRLAPEIWNKVRGLICPLWRHIRERLHGATATDRQTLCGCDDLRLCVLGNFPLADSLLHGDAMRWG
jgi:hypothetical protein